MKKSETNSKLRMSLIDEENVVGKKDIGLDKFTRADKILIAPQQITITNPSVTTKTAPGKKKTIYLSLDTLALIENLGSRLRLLDIESNHSKLITAALIHLNSVDDKSLMTITKQLE